MVYMGEKLQFGGRFHHSLFQRPLDICRMAEGMGALAMRVTRPGEIKDALARALSSGRPTVIEAVIDPEEVPPFGARMKMLDDFFAEGASHE
jgi:acetolactate synthase-1/2/3 large subunit